MDIEFVLPSGRFAKIRPIIWNDMILAGQYMNNPVLMVTLIACECTTIDGEKLTLKAISEMTPDEAAPICNKMSEMIKKMNLKGMGIA